MIIGSELGIGYDPGQHAAYAASWIQILEHQPLEIFRAAAEGEKIHTYLQSLQQQRESTLERSAALLAALPPLKAVMTSQDMATIAEPAMHERLLERFRHKDRLALARLLSVAARGDGLEGQRAVGLDAAAISAVRGDLRDQTVEALAGP